ncbi:hypothetical protein [Anabaena azotica]|uniref:Uncharacterized protein n=1 Tax=Anabaena azotica FACHB-119 TaxID=947527 RepID=A0ABR8D1J5_9NOST|nr:hypothetical protein [Anabaena azotica]MBD2500802.1 hypothetical protein [Anabaena azotica FACHB-119]
MFLQAIYPTASVIILGSAFGYVFAPGHQVIADSTVTASKTMGISYSAKSSKPTTKTAVIYIEGEKTAIALRLYEEYKDLFTTYFPDQDFFPEGVSSDEGTGVRFIANFGGVRNNNAYVN